MKLRLFLAFVVVCSMLSAVGAFNGKNIIGDVTTPRNDSTCQYNGNVFLLTLQHSATVKAFVCDMNGNCVAYLFHGKLTPGTHEIRWAGCDDNGNPVPPGSYLIKVQGDGIWHGHKVILLK